MYLNYSSFFVALKTMLGSNYVTVTGAKQNFQLPRAFVVISREFRNGFLLIYQGFVFQYFVCLIDWDCRIHQLLLCRGVRHPLQRVYWIYDTKQSDGEVPVMLELWRMQSTSSLPLLPSSLRLRVVAPDRVLSESNRTKLCTYAKQNCLKWNCFGMLNWIVWNRIVLTLNCE